jgi:hypothetical protein
MSRRQLSLIHTSKKSAFRILREFTGLQPKYFDCCVHSCYAFTGRISSLPKCPCGESRYTINRNPSVTTQQPRKQFCYLPLIPRLLLYYSDRARSKIFQTYPRTVLDAEGDGYKDSWSGSLFREHMKDKDQRHLVFTFSMDGVQVVRQKTHDI